MAEEQSLDAFLNKSVEKTEASNAVKEESEDEFSKLLNDFVTQGKEAAEAATKGEYKPIPEKENIGLDSFLTSEEKGGLDSFITQSSTDNNEESLDSMLTTITPTTQISQNDDSGKMKPEEQELARAIVNFQDGVAALVEKKNLKMPQTEYREEMLIPNYKPSVGKKIAQFMLDCWDVINKYDPENMKKLSKTAGDEEYLSFAETLNDTDLQLSIISYVEILINLEICEVCYEQKKEIVQKNRIKKELYEEYMELQARKNLFIKKLKEKKFPIDVDRLISNYFRAAQKDADGSFEALTKNPAMFSPIEFDKIRPKFFGLIKVTPEDGIKANQKIGEFIKKLKV